MLADDRHLRQQLGPGLLQLIGVLCVHGSLAPRRSAAALVRRRERERERAERERKREREGERRRWRPTVRARRRVADFFVALGPIVTKVFCHPRTYGCLLLERGL